jgi:hypothetical protein
MINILPNPKESHKSGFTGEFYQYLRQKLYKKNQIPRNKLNKGCVNDL